MTKNTVINITIEGPLKSGKTTVARLIEKALMEHDVHVIFNSPEKYGTDDALKSKLRGLVQNDLVVELSEKAIPRINVIKD